MKNNGRKIIRLNDQTDHGGHVIAASSGTKVLGLPAALDGDATHCPRCKGDYAILSDGTGSRHQGRAYAYHDDATACGARLIASLP